MPRAALIRPLAITALLLCLVVVVLGAYVRLSAAGLSCPDWPGCYGHLSPAGSPSGTPIEVGKAWTEMLHRYAAATLGVIILIIAALAIQYRQQK
ncbi:MAG TPA: COX15/CtaA family protein, partial [Steroidobacteraceae bacterium]|nr:COX15/CtaA family protein [Steroidobacteraceae bacterium]